MAVNRFSLHGLSTPPSKAALRACGSLRAIDKLSLVQRHHGSVVGRRVHLFEHLPQHTALLRQSFGNERDIE